MGQSAPPPGTTVVVTGNYVTINGVTMTMAEYNLLPIGGTSRTPASMHVDLDPNTDPNDAPAPNLITKHKYAIFTLANSWGGGAWSCPGHQAFTADSQKLSYVETWSYALKESLGVEVGFAKAELELTVTRGGQLTDEATGNKGQWICWWRRDEITQNNYEVYEEWTDIFGNYHKVSMGKGYLQFVSGVEATHKLTIGYTNCTM
jgi:hypothetical protein